jgi:hypothetical protein
MWNKHRRKEQMGNSNPKCKQPNWEESKQEILKQKSFVDKYGVTYKQVCLGKVSDLTPSRKHRYLGRPARNLDAQGGYKGYMRYYGDSDEQRDSDWWRDLIKEGKKHGIYIRPSSDKNRTFIMAGIKIRDRSET